MIDFVSFFNIYFEINYWLLSLSKLLLEESTLIFFILLSTLLYFLGLSTSIKFAFFSWMALSNFLRFSIN